jgi:hypothetical protein
MAGVMMTGVMMTGGLLGGLISHVSLRLDPALAEQAGFEAALDALAPLFDAVPLVAGERRHPLLAVTEDGGSRTSVQFWASALQSGLGLASPGDFPWCLANAACATIARRFALTGPNHTWLVESLASPEAFAAAAAVMADEGGSDIWVMASRFSGPEPRLALWHWAGPSPDAATRMARDWAASG